jgi:hypothetical protein
VALVIIDTVYRALCGADENDSGAIGAFIANLDVVRAATGAHAAAVHHTGKNAANGPRGSSAFHGDIDTMVLIDQGVARISDDDLGKQKDGAAGVKVGFQRVEVEIGQDADGEAVNSCVIESAALPSGASSRIPEGSHADRLLRLVLRGETEHGVEAPERLGLHPGARVIALEKIGRIFIDEYVALRSAGMSSLDDDDKRRLRKAGSKEFGRAVVMLDNIGKIKKDEQYLWFG